ncbi:putative U-box domain-containing protein 50 [Punica granatum]|uniref:U-box domain-containing protein 50 n=2 Tax=Punica granatum TaxID=22663 RepID=A0A6P8C6Q4_PUNGR|nr:putative U-box domain-containing protein 50 [Punica granatum]PKI42112.1 hypothetical protein CRG98_037565 [Punica granatum]
MEKIYVAVGNDLQEGFKTLEWALRKWLPADNPMIGGVVLVHVVRNVSNEFVYGPFGKFPASSVSDKMVEVLKKQLQDETESLLHKYIAFCGQVKAEVVKIEKYDEPIYKLLVDLISGLHMTKLVLDLTFIKATASSSSSSRKSRGVIRGSFYIHHHKPEFCELYIVCGGKLVHLREEDAEGVTEDDQGMMITAKMRDKRSFKGWLEKMMFPDSYRAPLPTNQLDDTPNKWEDHVQEIESYFQQLLSLKADEVSNRDDDTGSGQNNHTDSASLARDDPNSDMSAADKIETLKRRIEEAHQTIERKLTEAKIHAEGRLKAERAIRLCNQQIEDLGTCLKEERSSQASLQKDLEMEREQLQEVVTDTIESKRRLNSLAQVQIELSNKLRMSMLSKAQGEARLEKALLMRVELVREIEELRRQRDVLRRRIEFCKERDAIGMVTGLNEVKFGNREYTTENIRLATDNFSDRRRIKSARHQRNIYRGRIDHATTAIKICNLALEAFERKVRLLSQIRHPHVVAMVGFCRELKCIIFEYMHNGSLQDILNSSSKRSRDFMWHDRLRIAHEISLGLGFLHSAKPRPIIHGRLSPSNILLDHNLIAKLGGLGLLKCASENDVKSDIQAFGLVMLHLLTGSSCAELFEEAREMDWGVLARVLDERAGEWPEGLAERFGEVAIRSISIGNNGPGDSRMAAVIEELGEMRREAEAHLAIRMTAEETSNLHGSDDLRGVPSGFLCPIFRDIMKNPHVAADGFSYELEAIQEWLWTGHGTSPMTNLRLDHKFLTPNHILRSLIRDWQSQRSDTMSLED